MKFSIVMPVHNEEYNLRFSLPALFRLKPDEIIIVLDNCTDNSKKLIQSYAEKIHYGGNLKLIEVNEIPEDWNYRVAYLFRLGYKNTRNDAILTTAADIVFDQNIIKHIINFEKEYAKIISFGLKPYPLDRIYFVRKLISIILPKSTFSGVFLFSKKAWMETESEKDAKNVVRAQDTLTFNSIRSKFPVGHRWTNSLHLRSRASESNYYYTRGLVSYQVTRRSQLFVFVSSIIYLHPMMLVGYRHARRIKMKQIEI